MSTNLKKNEQDAFSHAAQEGIEIEEKGSKVAWSLLLGLWTPPRQRKILRQGARRPRLQGLCKRTASGSEKETENRCFTTYREEFFNDLPTSLPEEVIENVFRTEHVRIERIVSTGQSSPPGFWYNQHEGEWVILLRGGATLEFQDVPQMQRLSPGDYVYIPSHRKHRVFSTSAKQTTVWLAVFVETFPNPPTASNSLDPARGNEPPFIESLGTDYP